MNKLLVCAASGALLTFGLVSFTAPTKSAASTAVAPLVAADTYEIDAGHSAIVFRCMHKNLAWAYGRFNKFSGTIQYDEAKPETSSVSVTIDAASIDTNMPKRDEHLRSPDFLDAKEFPKATFTSTKVEARGQKLAITGDLSVHGVTKSVTFEAQKTGGAKGEIGFLGELSFVRQDFGINYGPDALGAEIHLTLSFEAKKK